MTFAVAAWFLGSLAFIQAATTFYFILRLRRKPPAAVPPEDAPSVAVILCVRGADPSLDDCLSALLELDYANYVLHVVVDSPEDPACEVVERAVAAAGPQRVTIQFLSEPGSSCSLKCSSVVQAIASLNDEAEVVALVDADTIVHRAWLSELVAPLADPEVAVATGSRWYVPADACLGTLARYIWNAAAVVQMVCYEVSWGGTLAIKRSFIQQADLLTRWGNALCEDTMLCALLRSHDKRQAFVPTLIMPNRESCSLGDCFHWVVRQLITSKLYHPSWLATVAHGVLTTAAPLIAGAALVVSVIRFDTAQAVQVVGLVLAFQAVMVLLMLAAHHAVASVMPRDPARSAWPCLHAILLLPVGIVVTQATYALAWPQALFTKNVSWRGVDYVIEKNGVRLQCYRPYAVVAEERPLAEASQRSL